MYNLQKFKPLNIYLPTELDIITLTTLKVLFNLVLEIRVPIITIF